MTLPSALLMAFVAGAAQAAPAAAAPGACEVLTFDEIREVQKVAVKDTKPSGRRTPEARYDSCVFATDDFSHSVSVTVITSDGSPQAVADFWKRTFAKEQQEKPRSAAKARTREPDPPLRRVSGLGSDAVWTGDSKAGSLYVLTSDAVLRISVGGVADSMERLRRSRVLAEAALARRKELRQP